jgi:hypothetical protein
MVVWNKTVDQRLYRHGLTGISQAVQKPKFWDTFHLSKAIKAMTGQTPPSLRRGIGRSPSGFALAGLEL